MSLLPALNTFSVFLVITGAGFLFLLVSLVFGEIFDHFDAGIDHDLGHGGPGFFSSRVLSVFITAFGAVGAIATHYGFGPVPSSAFGLVSGLVFGGGVYAFARFLYQQQASSDVLAKDLIGQSARVVVTIPSGGIGQVRCRVGEELIDKVARARDGATIPEHATVRVEEVLGEVVIVSRT
jgi:membrane protein implicated in regulation of membrane protease activity